MSWPHQDDGTVDWETVFEDQDIGLVNYVQAARSIEALGRCAHVIVQSLFIRDGDDPYREAFNVAIDELVEKAETDDHVREKLMHLVREVKANRIERAAHYIENGGDDEQRRHEEDDATRALVALSSEG
ncbi:hypothetical protein ACFL12_03910 [Pseudomonadota bacterium]